uniref:glutathione transferase n=1 Tax=Steinernema glaseri TaxID=37863 RepID=A0A1I7Y072_9BILA
MAYELIYFDIRGLAEMTRLLFIDQGIQFTDTRFSVVDKTEWLKIKDSFPFGQVPALKDGDKTIVQTGAIMRHLARKHNLYGDSEEDCTHADIFFEGVRDMRNKYARFIYVDWDVEGKREEFIKEIVPTALAQIESLLKTRQNGEHFVLGEKISFVDYNFFEELDILLVLEKTILDKFPVLKAYHKRMTERSNLQEHLKKRAASGIWINGTDRM